MLEQLNRGEIDREINQKNKTGEAEQGKYE